MSDPYNQYGGHQYGGYPPQNQYGSPAPSQGYPPPQQGGYGQPDYNQSYQQPDPYSQQQSGYPPQQQQSSSTGYYGDQQQPYQSQYGPPAQGGFQHGQGGQPPYDAYGQQEGYVLQHFKTYLNPNHSHSQYNNQYPGQPPSQQFPQQGAYPSDAYPNQSNAYGQPPQQGYGSTDPGAQQEGDRGLMGALGGGAAGYFGGNKMGGHGILGAIAGAVLGSKLEDKHKDKKHGKH
jgi:hypothetical protein